MEVIEEDMSMDVEASPPAKTVYALLEDWYHYIRGDTNVNPLEVTIDDSKIEVDNKRKASKELIDEDEAGMLKRLRIQKEKTRDALNKKMISRRPIPYIGDDTQTERWLDFYELIGVNNATTLRQSITKRGIPFSQNPYDETTWRNRAQLMDVLTPVGVFKKGTWQWQDTADFQKLYEMRGLITLSVASYSRPDLYQLSVKDGTKRQKFDNILYGDSELIMKVTPFLNEKGGMIDDEEILQIYNEIKIAFFLNELVYNYENVLSVHFMIMVDWYQANRLNMGIAVDPGMPNPLDTVYNQVTISELADTDMHTYMMENASLDTLRVVLFQILHTLETAWHTHEFIHYDLHSNNIRLKLTDYAKSPFKDRDLLYKRRDELNDWYVLPSESLGNHIVKIIDFGFSRLYGPRQPFDRLVNVNSTNPPHLHDNLIGIDSPSIGMSARRANRYTDVRMLFLSLFTLPREYWDSLGDSDRRTFYALASEVLDFGEMNRLIDELPFNNSIRRIRRYSANDRLTPENLSQCGECITYLTKWNGYARGNFEGGFNLTASDVLDKPFFAVLKRRANDVAIRDRLRSNLNEVVVSFIDSKSLAETHLVKQDPSKKPFKSSFTTNQTSFKCAVCHRENAQHYTVENTNGSKITELCGPLCAEFKYIYNSKTIFR